MMTTQPARTLAAKLTAIANFFALGEVLDHQRIHHSTNENYLVTTSQGEYLFKIIVNTTIEDICNGLPFLQRLEQQQFASTAYYLPSPLGEVAYCSHDCNAVVLRKLPGNIPDPSEQVCAAIGQPLAKLHLIPHDQLPEKRHWLDARYLPEAIQAVVARYGTDRLHETLKVFSSLQDFKPATFPQAIIHGDLCTVNCLFEGDQLTAFVDWQEIGIGAALIDFVSTVLGFCFIDEPEGADYWAIFDPNLYCALYQSYTSIRPFSDYEKAHLDYAFKYVGLTQPVWSMLMWDQYHQGQEMIETNTMYWKFGLDKITLPKL
ncbi:phosphotransferase [Tengunoibacter tsumagoiensis]|uniref:Aminoglycoside phosphotransferase domain-containing protein n=1 Tax=Tengunoibacter tsumagoiensis TaxID=2014871 RepID=A0A402AAL3_9CHLR|nr:phosphotransferase [Tengunoibacter tsumagoiensis]GCE15971.1 hypothetical protein KTT_58300 [Tengunoibacter tsumagoiensis]